MNQSVAQACTAVTSVTAASARVRPAGASDARRDERGTVAGYDGARPVGRGAPIVACGLPSPVSAGRSPPVVMLSHPVDHQGEA